MSDRPTLSHPDRRKVLIAIASGELGGGTTHVLQLLDGLAESRWKTALVCDPEGPLSEMARERGVELFNVPFMRSRFDFTSIQGLRRVCERYRPALLHTHGTRAGLITALATRTRHRLPFVYTEHGFSVSVPRRGLKRLGAHSIEAHVLNRASRIITLSRFGRETIRTLAPRALTRTALVPHGIDAQRQSGRRTSVRRDLGLSDHHLAIGTVQRLVQPKAPLDFVDAARRVHAAHPETRFIVIGEGPLRTKAENRARELRVPMQFSGERRDARSLLRGLDIFCLLSHWESLPLSILEAMEARLPVVATDVGGVASLVRNGTTGRLVSPADPAAAAAALSTLVVDPSLRESLGSRAHAVCLEHHSIEHVIERTEQVYEDVLETSIEHRRRPLAVHES